MTYEFQLLLTKSFTYDCSFQKLIRDIAKYIKNKNDSNFISSILPADVFCGKQVDKEICLQMKNSNLDEFINKTLDVNFVTISIHPNCYRAFLINEAKNHIDKIKTKIVDLTDKRKAVINKLENSHILKNNLEALEKQIDVILNKKSFTSSDEDLDSVLKIITRFTDHYNTFKIKNEANDLDPCLKTIKYIRRILSFSKLIATNNALNRTTSILLTIGQDNVINVSIFGKKDFEITENFDHEKLWIGKAYKHSNSINSIFDSLSNFYDCLDLNKLFDFDNVIKSANETEIKRYCFGYLSYSKNYFNKIWLKDFNSIKEQFACIKYYFSLVTTNILLYRDVSYTQQIEIVKREVELNEPNFSLHDGEFFKNNNFSAFDNFILKNNISIYNHSANAFSDSIILNTYDKESYDFDNWFINKIANNHKHRYGAKVDNSKIITSIIYSSMFDMAHSILRDKVVELHSHKNHLIRLFKAHRLSTTYSLVASVYSSHGPFIKNTTDSIFEIVFSHNNLCKH